MQEKQPGKPRLFSFPVVIFLFTDFGLEGPYIGQMEAVLYRQAPDVPVINLFADVPAFDIEGASCLLAAYTEGLPEGSIILAVVDPGVGGERPGAVVQADGRWYIGPDEGLFGIIARQAHDLQWWEIDWRPEQLSSSFHGRDLFAPVAAMIACGEPVPGRSVKPDPCRHADVQENLQRVVYVDSFGNAVTGLRASGLAPDARLEVCGRELVRARTFSSVPPGAPFWYENSNGLAEIAVNRGRANRVLGISVGTPVRFLPADQQ